MVFEQYKVAVVCDWLKDWGGAEQVLADILEIFPQAVIYSSIFEPKYHPEAFKKLSGHIIKTTWLDRIPLIRTRPKLVPFLRTYAFEALDLSEFDIVNSSSSAESK